MELSRNKVLDMPFTDSARYTVEIVSSKESLDKCSDAWNELAQKTASPMEQFDWNRACAGAANPNDELHVVVVYRDNQAVAIAPLYQRKKLFSIYLQLGVDLLGEPTDFIYKDGEAADALISYLSTRRYALRLGRVPIRSLLVSALQKHYGGRAFVSEKPTSNCPYIKLAVESRGPENILPKRMLSDLRRAERKAGKIGNIAFDIRSPSTAEEFDSLFAEFIRVESNGWKGASGSKTALAHDRERQAFFKNYCRDAYTKGNIRI
jgi:CelD/BcsL family acetyltransferase involved in cellulose biosynthesis